MDKLQINSVAEELVARHVQSDVTVLVTDILRNCTGNKDFNINWDLLRGVDVDKVGPTDLLTKYKYYVVSQWLWYTLNAHGEITIEYKAPDFRGNLYIWVSKESRRYLSTEPVMTELADRILYARNRFGSWVYYAKDKYGAEDYFGCDDISKAAECDVTTRIENDEQSPYEVMTEDSVIEYRTFEDYEEFVDLENTREASLYEAVKKAIADKLPLPVYFVFYDDATVKTTNEIDWVELMKLMTDPGAYMVEPDFYKVSTLSSEKEYEAEHYALADELRELGY